MGCRIRSCECAGIVCEVVLKVVAVIGAVAAGRFRPGGAAIECNRTSKYHCTRSKTGGTEADCAGNGGGSVHGEGPQDVNCTATIYCQ